MAAVYDFAVPLEAEVRLSLLHVIYEGDLILWRIISGCS